MYYVYRREWCGKWMFVAVSDDRAEAEQMCAALVADVEVVADGWRQAAIKRLDTLGWVHRVRNRYDYEYDPEIDTYIMRTPDPDRLVMDPRMKSYPDDLPVYLDLPYAFDTIGFLRRALERLQAPAPTRRGRAPRTRRTPRTRS